MRKIAVAKRVQERRRLQTLFSNYKIVDLCSPADCLERGIDTVLLMEYLDGDGSEYRDAGINCWIYTLPYADHYDGDRFDYSLYTENTFQRLVTSRIDVGPAFLCGAEIEKVLVVGQIQGDQSLTYGGRGYDSLKLVNEVIELLPNAQIRYRPHPKCIALGNKEFTADITWYPDPFLLNPIDGVEIAVDGDQMARTYADDLAWCDAVAMINSTAGYEALMAGYPIYHAGIPQISEHQGGVYDLAELRNGIRVVNIDYRRLLSETLNSIQSVGEYSLGDYERHERMLIDGYFQCQSATY